MRKILKCFRIFFILFLRRLQDELFINAWSRSHQFIKLDPFNTKSSIIGAAHIARGKCLTEEMRRNILRFQRNAKFTPWSRETMKIGFCSVPPAGHPASLLCLLNSTSMSYQFKTIVNQFGKLYKKKAHVHHYMKVDGFESELFDNARETLLNVSDKYQQVNDQNNVIIPRLKVL